MDLLDILEEKIGQYIDTNKPDEIRFNCPFCDDTDYHLYINIRKGVYHCFKCSNSGHLSRFNIPSSLLGTVKYRKPITQSLPSIPMDCLLPLTEPSYMGDKAINYLSHRGITTISELYCGIKDDWFGRVVFPIKENGNIVFLIGRSFLGRSPKYLNTKGKKEYIYQLDKASRYPYVVIVEGCMDALSTNNSIALLGKEITNAQYIKLVSTIEPSRPLYIGLDPDARKEAVHLAKRLSVHYKNINICLLPEGKDVNNIRGKWQEYPVEKYNDYTAIKLLLGG